MIQDQIPLSSPFSKGGKRGIFLASYILHLASAILLLTTYIHAQEPAEEQSNPQPASILKDGSVTEENLRVTSPPVQRDEFSEFEDEFPKEVEKSLGQKAFDPLQGYNRFMFQVNDKFYFWLLKPAAKGYNKIMPEFARRSFNRAFQNLAFPLRFVSSLFQFKFKKAGTELGRFVVNSTVGIGGLWDPAHKYLRWHPANEDLGQMLGRWGVGDGFPIVLPVLGQTNLRDGIGRFGAIWLYPVHYLADIPTNFYVRTSDRFNYASLHLVEYETIKKDALDPYTFIRDAYKQHRDREIQE